MSRELLERELLDDPDVAETPETEGNLRNMEFANRWLGGCWVVLSRLKPMLADSRCSEPVRILDLAAGTADIAEAVCLWARRNGIAVRITAVDRSPLLLARAADRVRDYPEIDLVQSDILDLNGSDDEFHYVVISQVLHHLTDDEALRLLKSANRFSLCGMIVSDLGRTTLSIAGSSVISRCCRNRITSHDSRVSFRNAFTRRELEDLAVAAELPVFSVSSPAPGRLCLLVDKRTVIRTGELAPAGSSPAALLLV